MLNGGLSQRCSITGHDTGHDVKKVAKETSIWLMISIGTAEESKHGALFEQEHDLFLHATGHSLPATQRLSAALRLANPLLVT